MKRVFYSLTIVAFIGIIPNRVSAQTSSDSTSLPYKVSPEKTNPYGPKKESSNIDFKLPNNVKREIEYDALNNQYIIRHKIGEIEYMPPYTMSFEEYQQYDFQDRLQKSWRDKYQGETFENQNSLIPKINIGSEAFETIFGSNTIDIRPSGSASLRFGIKISKNENPSQPIELQKNTTFDFKTDIQMSVVGKIGENLEMKVNYNTESQFDFENTMNLRYQGKEDDIIQKIEAGDVSLPLTTSLISGSQSLFGILSELKFGNLYITSVISQQEGETKTITVEGGAQKNEYNIPAVNYDKNRHFFISHYFRENYDRFLAGLPVVSSTVNITKVEVWVTNTTRKTENARNILALMDLGEQSNTVNMYDRTEDIILNSTIETYGQSLPDNFANSLYKQFYQDEAYRDINSITQLMQSLGYVGGKEFEKVEYARKLDEKDFKIDTKLGYISLNSSLVGDEVLAVAFEYTYNGTTYKVGEFSQDGIEHPQLIVLKLLKGSNFNPAYPNWKLMMKNIYSLGAFQVNKEDFIFEVEYYDDETGTRLYNIPDKRKALSDSLKDEKFIRQLNLDNLNSQLDYVSKGDGVFDYIDGVTITSSNGRLVFPMVEPFGGYMNQKILSDLENTGNRNAEETKNIAEKMTFQALYDSTQYKAEQITSKNKYYLAGTYKSSGGSEIFLNSFNIPQNSVVVTAGGIKLTENVDYTVDYNMGRVKILNESYLASGTPIKISLESNSLFSIQSKTLLGTHLDYRFNPDFNLGATIMNLTEKPLTQKVNMGEEPIDNTIWGLNGSYRTNVPFLTRLVDLIPLIETKEMSTITIDGEFAQLIPGHNDVIGESGNAFIDDFEGSESSIDLRNKTGWVLSSIPTTGLIPGFNSYTDLSSGFNRAKLAWYQIDPIFYRSDSPVTDDQQSNLQVYRVQEQDIFPDKDTPNGIPTEIATLDLAFYPNERGPYNYDAEPISGISAGIDNRGYLNLPETRWGGIMRQLSTNDFEAQNVEYIQFWMMDPFVEESAENPGGQLYFHLGNVSEDVLKDGRKSFEHGLPTTNPPGANTIVTTEWGNVPAIQPVSNAFVNSPDLRTFQDIGLDGLGSSIFPEGSDLSYEYIHFYDRYLNKLTGKVDTEILTTIAEDPSNDNYHYFRGSDFDDLGLNILQRYKAYNNHEGNTPVSENTNENYNTVGQQYPDEEDINGDFTLNDNEAFFEYRLNFDSTQMNVGDNYITNIKTTTVELANGTSKTVNWYQVKIPVEAGKSFGGIQDFKSIRFIRMFMHGWEEPVVLRFASLELVRSEWRKYDYVIKEGGENNPNGDESHDPNDVPFTVATVNIEENGSRSPVNYVLPPGVDRQQDPSNPQLTQLNEQSMSLKVAHLEDGYAKAVFKTINMDMRDYGKLQMYIHAESMFENEELIYDDDITCFVRIGSDFTDNYYEYQVPLKVTLPINGNASADPYIVWPEDNNMVIDFQKLIDAKLARNDAMNRANSDISLTDQYFVMDGDRRITIKGNPNIATVNNIMIGIRNPKAKYNSNNDDGLTKSAEIWVNELRLTDFTEKGGWAATGRTTARLADFGTVSVAGSTTQPGFGSIEQNAQQRSKEETNQIDVATNLELGKFFPKEANVRIPMFIGYSRTAINPEYNPLDQDVKLEKTLNDASLSEEEKKEVVEKVQDLTKRKSINFTNVGIGKTGKGKTTFYSPSNLSASYSYSELDHHDVGVTSDITKQHMAGLNYVFNNQPKAVVPFKKNKVLNKPAFKLIGDFNFYYAPQQVSFRTTMNRKYNERLLRNLNNPSQIFTPTYDKNFTWNRQFELKYNFSKGLKFDFSTNTNALIVEPEGEVNRMHEDAYERYKETVWNSIKGFGTPNQYTQTFNATYTIPINKIPIFNWISANARYGANYDWLRGPSVNLNAEEVVDPKHTIKNTQQIALNGQFNMDNLYNKVGFLERTNKKYKQSREQRKMPKYEDVSFSKENLKFTAGTSRRITHNLNTEEEIKVVAKTSEGIEIPSTFEIYNENKIDLTLTQDIENITILIAGKREIKENPLIVTLEYTGLVLMGFKQLSGSISQNRGTMVSGYEKMHKFEDLADFPGLPYVFGWQYEGVEFIDKLVSQGMLIDSAGLVPPYTTSDNITYNFKAQYQPFKELRIDFAGVRSETQNTTQYIFPDYLNGNYAIEDRMVTGNYNINIWMLGTSFGKKPTLVDPRSDAFEQYRKNLNTVAWRLANDRTNAAFENGIDYNPQFVNDTLYPLGYNSSNPDVAIPAFLAAFTGADVNKISTDFRSWKNFRPSWRIKYDGLTNLPFVGKYFRNVTLSNGYLSTFTVGNFSSNVNYDFEAEHKTGYSWATMGVDSNLFLSQNVITSFAATEQFVPLFGIDMTWKNNILSKFEYKKTRSMTMSLTNNQMVELFTWEYTIGTGYRFDKLKIIINGKPIVSDLNLRADFSFRDNATVNHDLAQNQSQVTQGQRVYTFKFTADYQFSEKLMLQAYYDHNTNKPMVGSFNTAETEFGFMVRFSLTQ